MSQIYTVNTIALNGMDYEQVQIQVEIATGLPRFVIVGLPDAVVSESKTRISRALSHALPSTKAITVNMTPASLRKVGSHYDLPIALCLLVALGILPQSVLDDFVAFGELALNGEILPCKGVLLAAMYAKVCDKTLICSLEHSAGAGLFAKVLAPKTLNDFVNHINHGAAIVDPSQCIDGTGSQHRNDDALHQKGVVYHYASDPSSKDRQIKTQDSSCLGLKGVSIQNNYLDLDQVKGQESAKLAMAIAASGGHHILLKGPPGSGKSMLARRMTTIMPELLPEQILDTAIIYSLSGVRGIMRQAPFREPHHSSSVAALVGGGPNALPGEISLAHNGVLFLDEFPEFSRQGLQALREAMETGQITVSRAQAHCTYPAKFLAIAAMNDCKCGMDPCIGGANCSKYYWQKISGPLLDRFDICVQAQAIKPWELDDMRSTKTSAEIKSSVVQARKLQLDRQGCLNSALSIDQLQQYLSVDVKELSYKLARKLKLSGRGIVKVLKVARTIADMDSRDYISREDLMQACSFRFMTSQLD